MFCVNINICNTRHTLTIYDEGFFLRWIFLYKGMERVLKFSFVLALKKNTCTHGLSHLMSICMAKKIKLKERS